MSVEQPFILVKLFGTATVSGHGVLSDLEVGIGLIAFLYLKLVVAT